MVELSVVIPTKDRPAMLPRALGSVLGQVDDGEVIVVDDGSLPENREAVREVCAADPRVRLVENEVSGGPSAARNRGIAAARGRYVGVLDDDDEWLGGKWTAQRDILHRQGSPEDLVVLTGVRMEHVPHLRPNDVPGVAEPQRLGSLSELFRRVSPRVFLNTFVMPVSLIRAAGCYDERMRWGEHTDLLIRISKLARFAASEHVGVLKHRRHEQARERAGRNWAAKVAGIELLLDKHREDFARDPGLRATYLHVLGVSELRAGRRWKAVGTFARVVATGEGAVRRLRAVGHLVLAVVGGPALWRSLSRARGLDEADL